MNTNTHDNHDDPFRRWVRFYPVTVVYLCFCVTIITILLLLDHFK